MFETPPEIPLWRAGLRRPPPFRGSLQRFEARAERLPEVDPAYRAVCGFADAYPLTWPAIAARGLQLAILTDPAFPLPVLGIVHARQQIRWSRPLVAGEPLSATCSVEGHRVVKSGGEFELRTAVSSEGVEIWWATTTILSRAIPGDGLARTHAQPEPFAPARSTYWRLPADLGRRYAAVSGDYNPIHLTALTARMFGFKRPIAHGWWLLARMLAELDHEVPAAGELEARFVSPVYLPGAATFESGPQGGATRFVLRGREPHVSGSLREC
jgi:acyl dehydratase